MSQNQATYTTLAALNGARSALHAARVESASHASALEIAQNKYLADSTAKHQAAVIGAEENARFAELRMTAAAQKFEAAKAAHAAHVESEQKNALDAARAAVSHDNFVAACANTVKRRAELRGRLAEADADIEKLVRGYAADANSCGAAAIDYKTLAESLTLRASGLDSETILGRVWGGAVAAQSMTAGEMLELAEHGTSPAVVNAKLSALRDAVRRGNSAAARCAQGLFLGSKADPSTTPIGQLAACGVEIDCLRAELLALGFGKAAAEVQSSELASRLRKAGPARVEGLLRSLRAIDGTPVGDYLTDAERAEKRDALAAPLLQALTELGFADEANNVRPAARATNAHTITPTDAPAGAFLELQAQAL